MGYAPSIAAHATILRQSGGAGLFRAFDAGVAPEEADIPDDQIEAVRDALDDALNPDDG
jgi:hypothetical protein